MTKKTNRDNNIFQMKQFLAVLMTVFLLIGTMPAFALADNTTVNDSSLPDVTDLSTEDALQTLQIELPTRQAMVDPIPTIEDQNPADNELVDSTPQRTTIIEPEAPQEETIIETPIEEEILIEPEVIIEEPTIIEERELLVEVIPEEIIPERVGVQNIFTSAVSQNGTDEFYYDGEQIYFTVSVIGVGITGNVTMNCSELGDNEVVMMTNITGNMILNTTYETSCTLNYSAINAPAEFQAILPTQINATATNSTGQQTTMNLDTYLVAFNFTTPTSPFFTFGPRTTDFSTIEDFHSADIILDVRNTSDPLALINFTGLTLNDSGIGTQLLNLGNAINANISINESINSSIYLNSTELTAFNSSALITAYNLPYPTIPNITSPDGGELNTTFNITYDGENLTFEVEHFTTYTMGQEEPIDINLSTCPWDNLANNTNYIMINDFANESTWNNQVYDCFQIYNKENIEIDCNGHTIAGNGSSAAFLINVFNNNITVKNCVISDIQTGLSIQNTHNSTFDNITLSGYSNDGGIYFDNGTYNTFSNNNIDMEFENKSGLVAVDAYHTIIENNTFSNLLSNSETTSYIYAGLYVGYDGEPSSNTTIKYNTFNNVSVGLRSNSMDGATVYDNNFVDVSGRDVHLDDTDVTNCLFYNNNFTHNGTVWDNGLGNNWNNSITGNHWLGYDEVPDMLTPGGDLCEDNNFDGFCDSSYSISGTAGAQDYKAQSYYVPGPSIYVYKDTLEDNYTFGDVITYEIYIENDGDYNLTDIIVTDMYDASELQFLNSNCNTSITAINESAGNESYVQFNISDCYGVPQVGPDINATFFINMTSTVGGLFTNDVLAQATGNGEDVNDTSSVEADILGDVEFDVTKTVLNQGPIEVNDTVMFKINMTNIGNDSTDEFFIGYDQYNASMLNFSNASCMVDFINQSGDVGELEFNLTTCYGNVIDPTETLDIYVNFTALALGNTTNKFTVEDDVEAIYGEDNTTVEIVELQGLQASNLEFYNGTGWNAIADLDYSENVEQVRVTCLDQINQSAVANAAFTLFNLNGSENNITLTNSTSNTTTVYTLDSIDFTNVDSGTWQLTGNCYLDNGSSDSITESTDIAWGTISFGLNNIPTTAQKDSFFTYNTTITCDGGECQDVNIYLDPFLSKKEATRNTAVSEVARNKVQEQISDNGETIVIVKLKEQAQGRVSAQSTFEASTNLNIVKNYESSNLVKVRVNSDSFDELLANNMVEGIQVAERNVQVMLNETVPIIGADDLWNHQINGNNITGEGVTVCIIDTGINYSHADFGGYGSVPNAKVIGSHCFTDDDNLGGPVGACPNGLLTDNDSMDDHGHGSHVAGIVSSQDPTYRGVAPDAKLVVVKALDSNGLGWNTDIIDAIDWCVANKDVYNISIISMSIGGGAYDSVNTCESANVGYTTAIDSAVSNNITVFVASGNQQNNISYYNKLAAPSCVGSAISVGAVDNNDNMAYFAQAGPLLDIVAPGYPIASTKYTGGHIYKSGTSMATPMVAGLAALITQYNEENQGRTITSTKMLEIMHENSVEVDDTLNSGYVYDRVNIADANNIKGLKGIIPVNDTSADFYTTNPNPYNDSNAMLGSMVDGEVQDFTWEVNATGDYASWTFFVFGEDYQGDHVESNETIIEIVDNTIPSVIAISPADNLETNTSAQTLTFNATDTYNTNLSCTLHINDVLNETKTITVGQDTFSKTFNDGTYTWNVNCSDDFGNSDVSATRTITIDASTPTYSNFGTTEIGYVDVPILINIGAQWNDNDLQNVSLYYGNNTLIETNNSPVSGADTIFQWNASADFAETNITFYMVAKDLTNTKKTMDTDWIYVRSMPRVVNGGIANFSMEEDSFNGSVANLSEVFEDYNNATLIFDSDANETDSDSNIINGILSMNMSNNFYGEVFVIVNATDGKYTTETNFTINVTSVNDVPTLNNPIADLSIDEEGENMSIVNLSTVFSDVETAALTFVVSDNESEVLTGETSDILYANATGDFYGDVEIIITAVDDEGSNITDTVILTVNNINDNPIITSSPVTSGSTNTTYNYQVTATDADNDVLNFSLITAPTGMTINSSTGLITWSINETVANYSIHINLTDGTAWTNQSYELAIYGAPTVISMQSSTSAIKIGTGNIELAVTYSVEMNTTQNLPTITFTPNITSNTIYSIFGEWSNQNKTVTYTLGTGGTGVLEPEVNITITDAKDTLGRTQEAYTGVNVLSVDTIRPTVISATAIPNPTKDGTVNVEVIFSESMNTSESPTVNITGLTRNYTLSESSYTGNNYTGTFTLLDDNEDTTAIIVVLSAQDAAGNNLIANNSAGTFDVDTVEPTITYATINSDNSNNTLAKVGDVVTILFTASETLNETPTASIDGNSETVSHLSGLNYSVARMMQAGDTEGNVTFTIDFSDAIGNTGTQRTTVTDSSSVIFDEIAPSFSANVETPADPATYTEGGDYYFATNITEDSQLSAVKLTFDGSDINFALLVATGTVEYDHDINNLAVGTYNYNWTATDAAGNTNVTSTDTYTINKATPTLNLSIVDDNVTYGENITATCSVNTAQVSPTILVDSIDQSATSYNEVLAVGTYNITCKNNAAENYTATQEEHTVVVNRADPNLTLTLDGASANINKNVDENVTVNASTTITQGTMTLHIDDPDIIDRWKIYNTGLGSLINTTSFNTSGIKTAMVIYAQTENYSARNVSYTINVTDNIDPTVTSVLPLNNTWETINPINFTYNASDIHGDIASCKLYVDGSLKKINLSAINESATNLIARITNAGTHAWKIRCYDDAGNDAYSETRIVKVDTQKPTTSAPGLYNGMIRGSNITIALTADDSGASGLNYTEYKIDAANWTEYNNSFEVDVSGTLNYRSVDLAGNVEVTKTISYTIDTVSPTIIFVTPSNGTTLSGIESINVTSVGASYVNFKIGSEQFDSVEYTSDDYLTELITENYANGNYILTATTYDEVGNTNSSNITVTINNTAIDTNTTAPTTIHNITGTSGTNGWYTSDVLVTLTANPGNGSSPINVTQWWNVSGSAWINSSTINLSASFASTKYRSIDNDSNIEDNRTLPAIKIDKTIPVVVGLRVTPTIPKVNDTVTIFANISDTISGLKTTQYIDIDGIQYPLTSIGGVEYKYVFVPTETTTQTATIYGRDIAGHLNSTESIDYSISQQEVEYDYSFVNDSTNLNDFENEIGTSVELTVNESIVGNLTISKFIVAPEFVNESLTHAPTYMNYEVSDNVNASIEWIIIKLYYDDVGDDEGNILGLDETTFNIYWYNETSDTWIELVDTLSFVNAVGVDTTNNYVWANVTHFSTYSFTGTTVDCDDVTGSSGRLLEDCYDGSTFRESFSGYMCDGDFQEDSCTVIVNEPGGSPGDTTTSDDPVVDNTTEEAPSGTPDNASINTTNQTSDDTTDNNAVTGNAVANATNTDAVDNSQNIEGKKTKVKTWVWILIIFIILLVGAIVYVEFIHKDKKK